MYPDSVKFGCRLSDSTFVYMKQMNCFHSRRFMLRCARNALWIMSLRLYYYVFAEIVKWWHMEEEPILAPPNLHLPLLHEDSTHLTWLIHAHLTNITAEIIRLTSNDLDSIGCYLLRLPFLLYCMTMSYLCVQASNKTLVLLWLFSRWLRD